MVCKTVNVQLQGQRVKGYRRGIGAGGGRTVPGVFQRSFDPQTERERERQTDRGPDHERDSNWICS